MYSGHTRTKIRTNNFKKNSSHKFRNSNYFSLFLRVSVYQEKHIIGVFSIIRSSRTVIPTCYEIEDPSIRAYGCCIYIQSSETNTCVSRILTAKSKVAPLKFKSLPRLELCAAQLLAKLWNRIKRMMNFQIDDVYFWTDSEIVLHWIKRIHPLWRLLFRIESLRFRSGQTKFRGVTCLLSRIQLTLCEEYTM